MFHNNLWETPLPVRLVAVGATHVQMWRSLTPRSSCRFSSYAVSLRTVHEVDYWATDAIPEDSRFYWKSFFRYSGEFRAVPLFIPMYGDAVRARSYPRIARPAVHPDPALGVGVTDIPYYIRNAFAHPEIPRGLRIRRLIDLWLDHINWAIAPFVIIFGSNLPLLLNPAFAQTTLGQNLPLYAAWLLTGAFCCLLDPGLRRGADRAAAAGRVGLRPARRRRTSSGWRCRSSGSSSATCRRSTRRPG